MPRHDAPRENRLEQPRIQPEFFDGFIGGARFALRIEPAEGAAHRGALLCIQPLGDEAVHARRPLLAQACRLARRGWSTLILDLLGTGDSAGDWAQARLQAWRSDLLRACRLVRERSPGPCVLWGARLGALLTTDIVIAQDQLTDGMLLWHPVADLAAADAAPGLQIDFAANARLRDELRELSLLPPPLGEHAGAYPVLMLAADPEHLPGMPPPRDLSALTEAWLEAGYLANLQMAASPRFWLPSKPSEHEPSSLFEATETFLDRLVPSNDAIR